MSPIFFFSGRYQIVSAGTVQLLKFKITLSHSAAIDLFPDLFFLDAVFIYVFNNITCNGYYIVFTFLLFLFLFEMLHASPTIFQSLMVGTRHLVCIIDIVKRYLLTILTQCRTTWILTLFILLRASEKFFSGDIVEPQMLSYSLSMSASLFQIQAAIC